MSIIITAFYAAILAIFALFLSAHAGTFRGKVGASVLYGEPVNMELAERVRRHQNFLEYVPIVIILMALLEVNGASATYLHSVGILTIIARVAHYKGLHHDNMAHKGRAIGAGGTALITLVSAGYLLWLTAGKVFG